MSLLFTLQRKSRPTRIGLLEEVSNLAITDLLGMREYHRAAREGGIKETLQRCVTEGDRSQPRPCLVHPEIQKVFKIPCHIESCGTCMNH